MGKFTKILACGRQKIMSSVNFEILLFAFFSEFVPQNSEFYH